MTGSYEDIIHLPRHISLKRPHMSANDRAAQFSPFAALTGYDTAINETARQTSEKIELNDDRKAELNHRLSILHDAIDQQHDVMITHFQRDRKKTGGSYAMASGTIKKIDLYKRVVVMQDTTSIAIDDILAIDSSLFDRLVPID